jgi:hypothetical protein
LNYDNNNDHKVQETSSTVVDTTKNHVTSAVDKTKEVSANLSKLAIDKGVSYLDSAITAAAGVREYAQNASKSLEASSAKPTSADVASENEELKLN